MSTPNNKGVYCIYIIPCFWNVQGNAFAFRNKKIVCVVPDLHLSDMEKQSFVNIN